eukprot:2773887-Rhodomonas_salina.2
MMMMVVVVAVCMSDTAPVLTCVPRMLPNTSPPLPSPPPLHHGTSRGGIFWGGGVGSGEGVERSLSPELVRVGTGRGALGGGTRYSRALERFPLHWYKASKLFSTGKPFPIRCRTASAGTACACKYSRAATPYNNARQY